MPFFATPKNGGIINILLCVHTDGFQEIYQFGFIPPNSHLFCFPNYDLFFWFMIKCFSFTKYRRREWTEHARRGYTKCRCYTCNARQILSTLLSNISLHVTNGIQLHTSAIAGMSSSNCLLPWLHHYAYNYFSGNFPCRRFPLMFIFRHLVYFLILNLNQHFPYMISSFSVINCQWSSRRILSLHSTIPLKVVSCKGYKNVNMD